MLYLFRWFTGALYLSLAIILALAIFEEPEVSLEKELRLFVRFLSQQSNWKIVLFPSLSIAQKHIFPTKKSDCSNSSLIHIFQLIYYSFILSTIFFSGCSNKEFTSPSIFCHCKFISLSLIFLLQNIRNDSCCVSSVHSRDIYL